MRKPKSEQELSNWRQSQRHRLCDQDLLWLCQLPHRLQAELLAFNLPFVRHFTSKAPASRMSEASSGNTPTTLARRRISRTVTPVS